jgi:hypothetical protein
VLVEIEEIYNFIPAGKFLKNEPHPDSINAGLIAYFPLGSRYSDESGNDHLFFTFISYCRRY